MTQNRGSEALPEEATELREKENVSYENKEIEEKKKTEELKERVGESLTSTDLPSSSVHTMEPNLETLDAIPSSFVQHRSSVLQGSPTTLNLDAKAESKETAGPPEKEIIAREAAQTTPSQAENQLQVSVCSTPFSEKEIIAREAAQTTPSQAENQLQVSVCSTPFSEKEIIAREAAQTPPSQAENQLQVSVCSTPFSELSPNSVTQSLSSVLSPTVRIQKTSRPTHVGEVGKNYPSGGKVLSPVSVARTSASDGFNWRKYGQKQVKSPTGSRSYYRCTHSNCCAKKIECCDHSGHVIEIVYKSEHSHDPPRKTTSIKESKSKSSNDPTAENSVSEKPIRVPKDSDLSISSEAQQEAHSTDKKQQNSSNNDGNGKFILKEEHLDKPELKRRKEKSELTPSDSSVKPEKKPKLVVHAAGDVGISGDGYRWRKYGQKMVKGNPHPRNYYRCTSAGCPVRKHIETAVDNSNAVIITYKGVHDHDMPVPKKRHGPPSAPLIAAAAPASMNNLQLTKPESPQNHKTSTKWSVGTEGELTGEAMDLGGEKAIESARTLLSIGFEIKPC